MRKRMWHCGIRKLRYVETEVSRIWGIVFAPYGDRRSKGKMASTSSEEIAGDSVSTPRERETSPGSRCPSPLGATPRPPLPHKYDLTYDGQDTSMAEWKEYLEKVGLRTRRRQQNPTSDSRFYRLLCKHTCPNSCAFFQPKILLMCSHNFKVPVSLLRSFGAV
jgi:hypothetical protein